VISNVFHEEGVHVIKTFLSNKQTKTKQTTNTILSKIKYLNPRKMSPRTINWLTWPKLSQMSRMAPEILLSTFCMVILFCYLLQAGIPDEFVGYENENWTMVTFNSIYI
jgi:hypothetical protein